MLATLTSHMPPIEADPRWQRFMARDAAADDTFVTAVLSTGIYCRASCPARRPKPENVRFFATCAEAEQAGFRSCKRCRPELPARTAVNAELVARACRTISAAEESPSLSALARTAGLSPFHFHRIFKTTTGVTPKAYADAERVRRMQAALTTSDATVTEAIFEAGYGSSGRFYAAADETLGMTPTTYRNGGGATTIRFAVAACSLGQVLVATSSKGVCSIMLGDDPDALTRDLRDRFPKADLVGHDPAFQATLDKVIALVELPGMGLDLPLDIAGTAFQRRVWEALRTIPAGQVATYREIADRIGQPKAVRAVAGACAANALAIAIPCHRVVHSGGSASGYRWGVERKRALLAREVGQEDAEKR